MFYHLIPLEELKRHSVTYWRPGHDSRESTATWVVLSELASGRETTIVDVSITGGASADAEDVLAHFLRAKAARS